jgi:hypothetical protein
MFALQLRAASVTAMVLPGVAVVAPESAGGAEPWRTAARLAEGFALRRIIEQGVAA